MHANHSVRALPGLLREFMGIRAGNQSTRLLVINLLAAALVTIVTTNRGWAQSDQEAVLDVPATRFRPAVDSLGVFDTEWADLPLSGSWDIRFSLSALARPLVFNRGNVELGALVKKRVTSQLSGALVLRDRLQLGASIPVVLYQTQDNIVIDDPDVEFTIGEQRHAGQGDARIALKGQILRQDTHGVALAGAFELTLPTARGGLYYGEDWPVFESMLAVARVLGPVRVAGNFGYRARRDIRESYARLGDEWLARMAARYQPSQHVPVGVALGVSSALGRNTGVPTYFEALLGVDAHLADWGPGSLSGFVMAGAGIANSRLGLGNENGVGTPLWRMQAGISLGRRISDRDHDGISDHEDRCPLLREDRDGYQDSDGCPEYDNDSDGVLDSDDRAPMEAEDHDGFGDSDGAPERDNDSDGVLDRDDRCPVEGGPGENHGCPDTDSDGDTIVDRLDRCPEVPGIPERQGCKKRQFVSLRGKEIEIMETLHFSADGALISKRSTKTLRTIADIMRSHPDIERLEIQGHTDDRGDASHNLALSQQRADTVRRLLIEAGVEPERLVAKGFGESQPIDSNATARGRARNRRVEFHIVHHKRGQSVIDSMSDPREP